jgi:hypothetical protein
MQNRFTEDDPTVFPSTTILIPISNEHSLSTTTQFFSFHSISSDSSKGFQRTIIIGISLLVLSSVFPMVLLLYKKKIFGVKKEKRNSLCLKNSYMTLLRYIRG